MSGFARYDVSSNGMLAFVQRFSSDASDPKSLALVGYDGKVQRVGLAAQPFVHPRLSPDGRHLAVAIDDGKNADVWVYDLTAGSALRRLTFGGRNLFPIWTRDGRFITYQSDREGDYAVFSQRADGSGPAERLTKPEDGIRHEPESWSADGKALTVNVVKGSDQSTWLFPVDSDATPHPIVDSPMIEKHSTFSPDGRWIAYMSVALAGTEVFIEPFPPNGAKYQVSNGSGRTPAWSPDGKRLLVVLPAEASKADAARDASEKINVVLNWFEELRTRAPAK